MNEQVLIEVHRANMIKTAPPALISFIKIISLSKFSLRRLILIIKYLLKYLYKK